LPINAFYIPGYNGQETVQVENTPLLIFGGLSPLQNSGRAIYSQFPGIA